MAVYLWDYWMIVPGIVPVMLALPTRPRITVIFPDPVVGPAQSRLNEELESAPADRLKFVDPEYRSPV